MKGVDQIHWEKEVEGHIDWTTDRCRLSAVLNNLISNAIKYRNLNREDLWIKIALKKNCTNYCITVGDNGLGIPPEHQSKVFEIFYRAHEHSSGSGLGLYVVKEIVHKMNGKIHLLSQPGKGSTFTIILPAAAA